MKTSDAKRARIAEMLQAGASYAAIRAETKCASQTIAAVKRELAEVDDTDVGCDEDAAGADEVIPEATGMLVDREYLATLEALRDQVVENARLRRVIAEGA